MNLAPRWLLLAPLLAAGLLACNAPPASAPGLDIRATFDDGVELRRDRVNICDIGTFRYTD